jgi:glycosyltransferase involved in cell wall biosynthesis
VLWVSTIREIKQPELFLKLAKAIPKGSFQMVGGVEDNNPAVYNNVKESSESISNLHFMGFVPFHEIDQYFEQASIFVNTSKYEGFPNTFIQAWMHYMPTVTLNADPDGLICKTKIGFHSKTFNQLVEDVKLLLKNRQLREERGRNAMRYVEKEHDITDIVRKYVKVFDHVLRSRRKI